MAKVILTDGEGKELFSKNIADFEKAEILKRRRQTEGIVEVVVLEKKIEGETILDQYNTMSEGKLTLESDDGVISKTLSIRDIDEYKITTNRSDELTEQLSFLGIIE